MVTNGGAEYPEPLGVGEEGVVRVKIPGKLIVIDGVVTLAVSVAVVVVPS